MCLPDSLSRVMSLALGYQERHLLGFYPIFRIEGAADHLDPEDWIPEPSLSKWRSPRGSDLQRFAKPFRKALSKTPQHHGSPPCLNFEGSPPVEGIGTDAVPRDILSSATLTNVLDPRGDSRAGARPPPTSSAVFRPIFRIEGAAGHLDPEDGFRLPVEAECRGSADTHNPDFTISSTHVHDRETPPIPIGLEEVFTTTSESLFTVVWNDCSRSMELLFTPHPPSSGGFRPTVSLSARAGSAGNPSSQA